MVKEYQLYAESRGRDIRQDTSSSEGWSGSVTGGQQARTSKRGRMSSTLVQQVVVMVACTVVAVSSYQTIAADREAVRPQTPEQTAADTVPSAPGAEGAGGSSSSAENAPNAGDPGAQGGGSSSGGQGGSSSAQTGGQTQTTDPTQTGECSVCGKTLTLTYNVSALEQPEP